jgi:hypothetical protein
MVMVGTPVAERSQNCPFDQVAPQSVEVQVGLVLLPPPLFVDTTPTDTVPVASTSTVIRSFPVNAYGVAHGCAPVSDETGIVYGVEASRLAHRQVQVGNAADELNGTS